MNCKSGLAVIVRTAPATASALGKLVMLTARQDVGGEPCWAYEGMPLRGRYPGGTWVWHELPDAWLRPITPPGDSITTKEVADLYAAPPKVRTKETV
jgi:hypothetical protein